MGGIGIIIKDLRKEMDCSQDKLAEAIGVTQDSISLWENDKRVPDAQYIVTMAKFFDVSADYLLGISGDYQRVGVGANYEQEFIKQTEMQLIRSYRKLNIEQKQAVDNLINIFNKQQ